LQANILLSLFHFFCIVEKELEKPLVYEAVSCSVEEGSSKGTTVGDYEMLNEFKAFCLDHVISVPYFSSYPIRFF
jgi:hypothetical protein